MSKAGCSIALVGVAVISAIVFYSLVSPFIGVLQFFSGCTPSCGYQGSDRQAGDFFLALLFCLVVIGFVMIMRTPDEAERGDGDESPK